LVARRMVIGTLGSELAGVPGGVGEAMWAGYGGTFFWIDPKEQLVAILRAQTSAATRASYRRLMKALVYQAIDD
jgi:CubicO group peptidase (beta-lactamase class C family)